jgi:hypothetical protein
MHTGDSAAALRAVGPDVLDQLEAGKEQVCRLPETSNGEGIATQGNAPVGESIADQVQQGQPVGRNDPQEPHHDHLGHQSPGQISMACRVVPQHER